MKGLVIINAYVGDEKFTRQGRRIADELNRLGLETELVRNGTLLSAIEENGETWTERGEEYAFAVYLDKDKYLSRILERSMRLFNPAAAIEACDDKFSTYLALRGAGVKTAKSIPAPLCYTAGASPSETYLQGVANALGFPLIAKKSYGSFGAGVQLVHGYAELQKIEAEWLHIPHFYQAYIAESRGRDIRVIVIGGKAVAAMERVAKSGEFRSNIELGGKGRAVELTAEYGEAAERAAKALSIDYCGVDLLEGKEGAVVCEVNSNAFFEGMEEATGLNIARLYAEHIHLMMEK